MKRGEMVSHKEFQRVNKRTPCPICDKPDWCLIAPDESAAICARVQEGSVKRCGEAGWLHRLNDNHRPGAYRPHRRTISPPAKPAKDFAELAQRYQDMLTEQSLNKLVVQLGVSADSLRRLQVGWNGAGYTFPMRDETGAIVGLRVRYPSGTKVCETGSRQALFIPTDIPARGLLLICEGPSDTAAALDLDFSAVGRPSCNAGARMLSKFASGRDVALIADNDKPGRKGAEALAGELILHCPKLRIVYPPDEIKDLRQWKAAGLARDELRRRIKVVKPITLTIKARIHRQRRERE